MVSIQIISRIVAFSMCSLVILIDLTSFHLNSFNKLLLKHGIWLLEFPLQIRGSLFSLFLLKSSSTILASPDQEYICDMTFVLKYSNRADEINPPSNLVTCKT